MLYCYYVGVSFHVGFFSILLTFCNICNIPTVKSTELGGVCIIFCFHHRLKNFSRFLKFSSAFGWKACT